MSTKTDQASSKYMQVRALMGKVQLTVHGGLDDPGLLQREPRQKSWGLKMGEGGVNWSVRWVQVQPHLGAPATT